MKADCIDCTLGSCDEPAHMTSVGSSVPQTNFHRVESYEIFSASMIMDPMKSMNCVRDAIAEDPNSVGEFVNYEDLPSVKAAKDYDWLARKPRDARAILERFGLERCKSIVADMEQRMKWDDGWRLFFYYPPELIETLDAKTGKMWREFFASSYAVNDKGERINEEARPVSNNSGTDGKHDAPRKATRRKGVS